MKIGLTVVLFFAVMFFDGIIFPAFFGFREGILTVIFLVAVFLYYKVSLTGLVLGVVFSGSAEFYWGLKMGTLILPLLASAAVLFLLNTFFNIRSIALTILSGVTMFAVFWETSVLVSKII